MARQSPPRKPVRSPLLRQRKRGGKIVAYRETQPEWGGKGIFVRFVFRPNHAKDSEAVVPKEGLVFRRTDFELIDKMLAR